MQILKLVVAICMIAFTHTVNSQINFYHIYTNNGYDFGEGITQLPDSSYLITGSSSSFGDAPAQAFILQVDSLGNYVWSKSYGGSESDWGRRIFHVPNDGIYVAGYSNSFGNNAFDFYFFKTDVQGNLIYQKNYGGPKREKLFGAAMLPDTTFILVGETASTDNEVEDIFMMRLNAFGDTLWTKQMGNPLGADRARNVAVLNDTTVLVVGDYYDSDSLMQKAFIMKLYIDGTFQWFKWYGNNQDFSLNDLTIHNGMLRAVGYNKRTNSNGSENSYLYRWIGDTEGNPTFELIDEIVNYSRLDYITSYGNQGKFYVVEQATDVPTPTFGIGEDCLIQRYTDYLFWDNGLLNTSNLGQDQGNQIIPTSDGGAIMVGYNTSYGKGGNNVTLVKIGPNDTYPASYTAPIENQLVFTEELEADFKLAVYPNPTSDQIQITSDLTESLNYSLLDVSGKLLLQDSFTAQALISLNSFQAGVYFLQVGFNQHAKTVRIVKK